MQHRPQHAVGETAVIFVEILAGEVADDEGIAFWWTVWVLGCSLTSPLQPIQTAGMVLQRRLQHHFQPPAWSRLFGIDTRLEIMKMRANSAPPNSY